MDSQCLRCGNTTFVDWDLCASCSPNPASNISYLPMNSSTAFQGDYAGVDMQSVTKPSREHGTLQIHTGIEHQLAGSWAAVTYYDSNASVGQWGAGGAITEDLLFQSPTESSDGYCANGQQLWSPYANTESPGYDYAFDSQTTNLEMTTTSPNDPGWSPAASSLCINPAVFMSNNNVQASHPNHVAARHSRGYSVDSAGSTFLQPSSSQPPVQAPRRSSTMPAKLTDLDCRIGLCFWGAPLPGNVTVDAIRKHLNSHHSKILTPTVGDRLLCPWIIDSEGSPCGKELDSSGLAKHIAVVHLKLMAENCRYCEASLSRSDAMLRHLLRDCKSIPLQDVERLRAERVARVAKRPRNPPPLPSIGEQVAPY